MVDSCIFNFYCLNTATKMDLKIEIVRKRWSQRMEAFGRSSVVVVDDNGNRLLDIPPGEMYTMNEKLNSFREINDMVESESALNEAKESGKNEEFASKNDFRVDMNDLTVISGFFESKKQEIFTAKLNNSNHICFMNGQGMLLCRGKFNISEKNKCTTSKDEQMWKNKHFDTHFDTQVDRHVPLLVASKVFGLLIVVTGDSSETSSMVEKVKEFTRVLADV